MKVAGKCYKAAPRPHLVRAANGEEVELTIAPLPTGFLDMERTLLPEPRAPQRLATAPNGKLLRENGRPVPVPDEADPRYQEAMLATFRARGARILYAGLQADPSVAWETTVPPEAESNPDTAREVYGALAAELEASGFGPVQLIELAKAINELSGNRASENVEAALGTFRT